MAYSVRSVCVAMTSGPSVHRYPVPLRGYRAPGSWRDEVTGYPRVISEGLTFLNLSHFHLLGVRMAVARFRNPVSLCLLSGLLLTSPLLAAGCGLMERPQQERPAPEAAASGLPVTEPDEESAPPSPTPQVSPPGETATPAEQILYDLQSRVVLTAGVPAPTTAECDASVITGTIDQHLTCTVTYQGLTISYEVQVEGGRQTFSWRATTTESVLTAAGVQAAYWRAFHADHDELRCDDMPEAELVPLSEDTGYRCYRRTGERWEADAVVLQDGEILFA